MDSGTNGKRLWWQNTTWHAFFFSKAITTSVTKPHTAKQLKTTTHDDDEH